MTPRAAGLAGLLDGCGLLPAHARTHERARNVLASPLGGLDGRSHADVRGWVAGLDAALCASPQATALSGRFLFALDDGRGDIAGLGGDVTLIASAGGGPGGTARLRLVGTLVTLVAEAVRRTAVGVLREAPVTVDVICIDRAGAIVGRAD